MTTITATSFESYDIVNSSDVDPFKIFNDPSIQKFMNKYFPEIFSSAPKKNYISRASYKAGRATGKVKNFFSKTETKAATLLAYWAADSLVAILVILTTASTLAIVLASAMFALHTYATFSVISEIM